ncbi:alpha/beta fold hydrolase [Pseudalkalibacillus sp. Hm43]|uniref:alpha/beta fold hydrolase n=1 Tax=Pseudalkalibacillus sp. Hm43 TaxID=3450742 RepID=UPI003F4381B2
MRDFTRTIDGHTFYGYESGNPQNPKILCLHGLTSDSFSFVQLTEFLNKKFHLILLDLPGHGDTDPFTKERDYRFSTMVDKLNRVVETITTEPFSIIGHSWGGDLALHFAKEFPSMVRGVVLIDGGYMFPENVNLSEEQALEAWKAYMESARYKDWNGVLNTYQDYTTGALDASFNHLIRSNFREVNGKYHLKADVFSVISTIRAFYSEPCSTTYQYIHCPVLLFHATQPEKDPTRSAAIKSIYEKINDLNVIGIENTKHNVHWDCPEDVAKEIIKWIEENADVVQ